MSPVICVLFIAVCAVYVYAERAYRRWLADQPHIPTQRNHEED